MNKMKTAGVLGLGKMGGALVHGLLSAKALRAEQIMIYDLNKEAMDRMKEFWPGIQRGVSSAELANTVDTLFIVVEPKDVRQVLEDIKEHLHSGVHVVSLAACVRIENVETVIPSLVSKAIPAVLFRHGGGVSLLCHGRRVDGDSARYVEELFAAVSPVRVIEEDDFEAIANSTSVGPAFLSALCRDIVTESLRHTSLSREEGEKLLLQTMKDTALMLEKEGIGFGEMVDLVATRGGITEAGILYLEKAFPPVLEEFYAITLGKHESVKAEIRRQYE